MLGIDQQTKGFPSRWKYSTNDCIFVTIPTFCVSVSISTRVSLPREHHGCQSHLAANRNTRPGRAGCETGGSGWVSVDSLQDFKWNHFYFTGKKWHSPGYTHLDILMYCVSSCSFTSTLIREAFLSSPKEVSGHQFKNPEVPVVSRILTQILTSFHIRQDA